MTPTAPNVAAVMTRMPIVLSPDAPLELAARTMAQSSIRHLPIVEDGAFVGLISDRDLLAAQDGDERVRDVMTVECAVTRPDANAAEAAATLLTLKIGCLPVLQDGALFGIVTETDFVRVAYAVLAAVSSSVTELAHPKRPQTRPAKPKRATAAKKPPRRRPTRARA